jgi:hypothetical protein
MVIVLPYEISLPMLVVVFNLLLRAKSASRANIQRTSSRASMGATRFFQSCPSRATDGFSSAQQKFRYADRNF